MSPVPSVLPLSTAISFHPPAGSRAARRLSIIRFRYRLPLRLGNMTMITGKVPRGPTRLDRPVAAHQAGAEECHNFSEKLERIVSRADHGSGNRAGHGQANF